MVWFKTVVEFEFAIGCFVELGELFFGDVRGGVLHQVFFAEKQEAWVVLLGSFEPALEGANFSEGVGFRRTGF